jgi:ribonuclease P protein component
MRANPMKEYVNRVGLTVSKKLGGAVERNRVKRILREGLRQTEQDLNLKKGYLIVIVARSGAVNAKSDQIKRELTKGFRSLNMIENKQ